MKHLKIYEEFGIQYKLIDESEVRQFISTHKMESFDKKVYDWIKSRIFQLSFNQLTSYYGVLPENNGKETVLIKKTTEEHLKGHLHIHQYEDEYYLIKYVFGRISTYSRYYLCDQKEGLFRFVDDYLMGALK